MKSAFISVAIVLFAMTGCSLNTTTVIPDKPENKLLVECVEGGQKIFVTTTNKVEIKDQMYLIHGDTGVVMMPFKCPITEITEKQLKDMQESEKRAYEEAVKRQKEAQAAAKAMEEKKPSKKK